MFQSLGSILFVIFNAPWVTLSFSSYRVDNLYYGRAEDYPYVVGVDVLDYNIQPKKIKKLCTGTYIIEHNYILTAASCVVSEDKKFVVGIGGVTIIYNDGDTRKTTNPKKIIVHPGYFNATYGNFWGEMVQPFDLCILVSERELRGGATLPLGPTLKLKEQDLIDAQTNNEPCIWAYYNIKYNSNRGKVFTLAVRLEPYDKCQQKLRENRIVISEEAHLCVVHPGLPALKCDMVGGPLVCSRWPGVIGTLITAAPCSTYVVTNTYLLFTRLEHSVAFLGKNFGNITSGTSGGASGGTSGGAIGGSDSVTTESGASCIYSHTGIVYVILCSFWKSGIETNVGI